VIYRNSSQANNREWTLDENPEAPSVARDFLAGEYDLLVFTRAKTPARADLEQFLESTKGMPLIVQRASNGDVLVTGPLGRDRLLLTGRTADVLCGYLDNKIVRMEDRFDMTVRRSFAAL
jgi:hypothetical protein